MHRKRRRLSLEILELRRVLSAEGEGIAFVNIPDNLTGSPGQAVTAPVNIDDAAGVRAAEIRIRYDTTLLDADAASVLLGSVWPDDAEVIANVNDVAGTIIVAVFAAEELETAAGSLAEVRFVIRDEAAVGQSTALDLTRVRLNEGDITPDPEPVAGPDPADGRITFVGAEDEASISGFVYADTNVNNQPDQFEGIPRVRIVLTRTDNGQERITFTDDDGSYAFNDLAPGSYRIEQRQPAAFLDGGPNEITVTLAADQNLRDQNFRERGLRPEFVYTRLFSTAALPVGSANWVAAVRNIVEDAEATQTQNLAQSASAASSATASSETPPEAEHGVSTFSSLDFLMAESEAPEFPAKGEAPEFPAEGAAPKVSGKSETPQLATEGAAAELSPEPPNDNDAPPASGAAPSILNFLWSAPSATTNQASPSRASAQDFGQGAATADSAHASDALPGSHDDPESDVGDPADSFDLVFAQEDDWLPTP